MTNDDGVSAEGIDALVEALFQKGYRTEDVVAIRITGDESLNLYVVPFPY